MSEKSDQYAKLAEHDKINARIAEIKEKINIEELK